MNGWRWTLAFLLLALSAYAQSGPCAAAPDQSATLQFFDEPQFIVAGVTDNTYRGGHGSDTVLRSAEVLAKDTASLSKTAPDPNPLEAVHQLQRAAELNPSDSNLFDWATELLAHRAPESAAEVFTKGVRLFPQSVRMLLGLATARYAAGSYEQAAQCFFKAADLNPSDPSPYLFLGKVQAREITQSAGYEERMARFARLQPNNALANYYYAVTVWNRRSASQTARALLEKAVALDPHLGLAYLQLGIVDDAERKYADAMHAYQQAIAAAPDIAEAHYRLSEAYRLTGDKLKAERELLAYKHLSAQSAEKVERERKETQQFVIALRKTQ